MPGQEALFLVTRNERNKVPRLVLTLFLPLLLLYLLSFIPLPRMVRLLAWLLCILPLGWFLVFVPAHWVEVYGDRLMLVNLATDKGKEIPFAEIRGGRFTGFSLFRCLVLTDASGAVLARMESDMQGLDNLTELLKKRQIPISYSKERN